MKNTERRKRLDFLNTVSPSYAEQTINSYNVSLGTELVKIEDARGRILAEDFFAPEDLPYFDRSLVDGYAILSKDSQGASETSPVMLLRRGSVSVGELPSMTIHEGECVYLSTGACIPQGADSVVMQEFSREIGDIIEILRPVHRGENVIHKGEDIKRGDLVFSKGRRISPFDIGVFAALGLTEIPVVAKPKVGIMSTGDEVVSPSERADKGKVRDINSYLLMSLFLKLGGEIMRSGIAKDEVDDVVDKLSLLRGSDLFCISGGSSKGERDIIVEAVKRLGGQILFHGVNIKPGKPFFYGLLWDKPFFGLPGHPLSCAIVAHRFALPLFLRIAGHKEAKPKTVHGILSTNVPSSYGIEEYVNVRILNEGKTAIVEPIFAKSATIWFLSISSGYIIVDENREGYEKGEEVQVFLYES